MARVGATHAGDGGAGGGVKVKTTMACAATVAIFLWIDRSVSTFAMDKATFGEVGRGATARAGATRASDGVNA